MVRGLLVIPQKTFHYCTILEYLDHQVNTGSLSFISLRSLLTIVYIYAGIAKINEDWLLR
jgi:hypothetical protein